MPIENDYKRHIEQYLALKEQIIKLHTSKEQYFASLGYE